MAFTEQNTDAIAFKKVLGKSHTQENFSPSEEGFNTNVQVSLSSMFYSDIEVLPVTNSGLTSLYDTNGIIERVKFPVEIISDTTIGINKSQGYKLKLPSDYNTFGQLYPDHTSGEYLHLSVGKLQIVPSNFGQLKSDGSTEYDPILYQTNGTTIIPKNDPINWYLDTYSGILFVQDPPTGYDTGTTRPGFVEAYLYVAKFASEVLSGITSATNVGTGTPIFRNRTDQTLNFKTISVGNSLSISANTDNTLINFTGVTGASNGLNRQGKIFKLGGTLTGNTLINTNTNNFLITGTTGSYLIDVGGGINLNDNDSSGINITSNGGGIIISDTASSDVTIDQSAGGGFYAFSTESGVNISGTNAFLYGKRGTYQINGDNVDIISKNNFNGVTTQLRFSSTESKFYDSRTGTTKGIEYNADYSSNYVKRSLVDKGYVTGLTSSINTTILQTITGATNGLTVVGKKIKLGGVLTGTTNISGDTKNLTIGTNNSKIDNFQTRARTTTIISTTADDFKNAYINLSPDSFTLAASDNNDLNQSVGGSLYDLSIISTSSTGTSQISLNALGVISVTSDGIGAMKYDDDYSSNFISRSLVDKGYVTGITSTLVSSSGAITGTSNGLTRQGNIVKLGGKLTGATTIGLSTNSLTFTGTTGTLKYGSDLSAQYTLRSLVDKGYVTGITTTKLNTIIFNSYTGTTNTAINNRLLTTTFNSYTGTTNTAINNRLLITTFNTYTGTTNSRFNQIETNFVTGATNGLSKRGKNVVLGGKLTGATTIGLSANNLTLTGTTGTLKYGSDLSSNFTSRSLPDVAYVTGLTLTKINEVSVKNTTLTSFTADTTSNFIGCSGVTHVYLPTSPKIGQQIIVTDIKGVAFSSPITIHGNTKLIEIDTDILIDSAYGSITLMYNGIMWSITGYAV